MAEINLTRQTPEAVETDSMEDETHTQQQQQLQQQTKCKDVRAALDEVIHDSSAFLVIGLTGRTGSGCSTSAKLLSSARLPLPDVDQSHYTGNEKRKYRIIKRYIDCNWQEFYHLKLSIVLARYIFELSYPDFLRFVQSHTTYGLQEITIHFADFRPHFEKISKEVSAHINLPEETKEDIEAKKESAYDLYFNKLTESTDSLKKELERLSLGTYTKLFQAAGDNVRSSGMANSSKFNPGKLFNFPKALNKIIKAVRHIALKNNRKCFIVIDAIRSPYEATFLRERYSKFYLISINTLNENRLRHLRQKRYLSDQQIRELDGKEYPPRLQDTSKFISQDIQKCIEISDIHINNPKNDQYGTSELASQLAWYVTLMLHPGLITPTAIESCMQIAYSVKQNSGCISRQVGALVADASMSVKAVGWNSTPEGQIPCLLRSVEELINGNDQSAFSEYERNNPEFQAKIRAKFEPSFAKIRDSGRSFAFCFKDVKNEIDREKNQVHTRSLHAEENAILQISKHGGQHLKNGILFTTASPCELCSKETLSNKGLSGS
jgi:deoxycytidylate deaminase